MWGLKDGALRAPVRAMMDTSKDTAALLLEMGLKPSSASYFRDDYTLHHHITIGSWGTQSALDSARKIQQRLIDSGTLAQIEDGELLTRVAAVTAMRDGQRTAAVHINMVPAIVGMTRVITLLDAKRMRLRPTRLMFSQVLNINGGRPDDEHVDLGHIISAAGLTMEAAIYNRLYGGPMIRINAGDNNAYEAARHLFETLHDIAKCPGTIDYTLLEHPDGTNYIDLHAPPLWLPTRDRQMH